jgi:hypothetical protein
MAQPVPAWSLHGGQSEFAQLACTSLSRARVSLPMTTHLSVTHSPSGARDHCHMMSNAALLLLCVPILCPCKGSAPRTTLHTLLSSF